MLEIQDVSKTLRPAAFSTDVSTSIIYLQNYTNGYIDVAGADAHMVTNSESRFWGGRQQLFSLDKYACFCYYY